MKKNDDVCVCVGVKTGEWKTGLKTNRATLNDKVFPDLLVLYLLFGEIGWQCSVIQGQKLILIIIPERRAKQKRELFCIFFLTLRKHHLTVLSAMLNVRTDYLVAK